MFSLLRNLASSFTKSSDLVSIEMPVDDYILQMNLFAESLMIMLLRQNDTLCIVVIKKNGADLQEKISGKIVSDTS